MCILPIACQEAFNPYFLEKDVIYLLWYSTGCLDYITLWSNSIRRLTIECQEAIKTYFEDKHRGDIFNRPGIAGAVLRTPLSLID